MTAIDRKSVADFTSVSDRLAVGSPARLRLPVIALR